MEWKVGPSSPEGPGGSTNVEAKGGPSCSAPVRWGGTSLLWGEVPSTLRVPAAATVSTSGAINAPHTPPKEPTTRMPPDTSNVSRGAIVPAENHQFRQKKKNIIQEVRRDVRSQRTAQPRCFLCQHASPRPVTALGVRPRGSQGSGPLLTPSLKPPPHPCIPSLSRPGDPQGAAYGAV